METDGRTDSHRQTDKLTGRQIIKASNEGYNKDRQGSFMLDREMKGQTDTNVIDTQTA